MADSAKKYFSTRLTGLEVVIGQPDPTKGEVAPKTQGFVPYWVEMKGEEGPGPRKAVKIGFLETSEKSVIDKLEKDFNVQTITQDDFEAATVVLEDEAGVQISGFRAPY